MIEKWVNISTGKDSIAICKDNIIFLFYDDEEQKIRIEFKSRGCEILNGDKKFYLDILDQISKQGVLKC